MMKRSELKSLVKECLIEILSENFINKVVKECVQEKIVVEVKGVSVGGAGNSSKLEEPKQQMTQPKKILTESERANIRRMVSGEEDVLPALSGFSPQFKELAKDTIQNEVGSNVSNTFSRQEQQFLDFDRIKKISEKIDEKEGKS